MRPLDHKPPVASSRIQTSQQARGASALECHTRIYSPRRPTITDTFFVFCSHLLIALEVVDVWLRRASPARVREAVFSLLVLRAHWMPTLRHYHERFAPEKLLNTTLSQRMHTALRRHITKKGTTRPDTSSRGRHSSTHGGHTSSHKRLTTNRLEKQMLSPSLRVAPAIRATRRPQKCLRLKDERKT